MSWGFVALGVGGVVGGLISSKGSKDAAAAQTAAAQQGIESQEAMYDKSLEIQQPYREAGYGAIEGLQGLIDPAQRAQTLKDYYGSEEFGVLQAQDEEQQLRNAAATGGTRGGGNIAGMSAITPQLGMKYMQGLQNQYTGLANMGMGAASQGAQGAQNLGFQTSALQQQAGQAQAQNSLAQANIWGDTANSLGGLAYNKWGQ